MMEELLNLIRKFEGLRLKSYLCPAGVWTIGYGSTGPGIGPGLVWTLEQAETRLACDASKFLSATKSLCPSLSGKPLIAITDFAYNLGATRLSSSTLRRKINQGDYVAASEQLRKWVHAGGIKLPGLVLRREAEIALLLG